MGIVACEHSSGKTSQKINQKNDQKNDPINLLKTPLQEIDSQESFSLSQVKVLMLGSFHDEEVWKNAEKEKWFGLFRSSKEQYLSEIIVNISRIFDPITDQDSLNNKTGWLVESINKDDCIALIAGLPFLNNHKIEEKILSKNEILPNEELKFNYLGIDYKLFATGEITKDSLDPSFYEIHNYKLFLKSTKNGKEITDKLVETLNFDDAMINILFAGDIDNDGILDLIIDTSRHYNKTEPTIYLSKPSNSSKLLKIVGRHSTVGC